MDNLKKNFFLFIACILLSVLGTGVAVASSCQSWVAKIVSIQGIAEQRVLTNNQESWQAVQTDTTFCPQDVLRVRENSRVALILSNDTLVRLDENTTITFTNISPDIDSTFDLKAGIAHFISRVKHAFKVITPFVNASIEGTEFVVAVNTDQAQVTVFEGKVRMTNDQGELLLLPGQSAIAKKDQAPVLNTTVKPRDAVQWALYYPSVIDSSDTTVQLPQEWQDKFQQSLAATAKGNTNAALTAIDALPDTLIDATVYTYRAGLRLAVGRVDKASADIARALTLHPNDSNALALQSIIAVVQNDAAKAETLAQQAITNNNKNAAAYLALSYAKQAQFDLAAATTALQEAPKTALVASRQAELALMQGDLDSARRHAKQAVKLNPNLSHTQTTLGFAELVNLDLSDAKNKFEQAIQLDQANPLAHLGLGLTDIHAGELTQGRREIEVAASLDPNNALIRSYLGKAYFEEKRDKVAADQFAMAEQLDPNDPTPWFYDAVRKQSDNDPVSALNDIQKSIAINDNRAVYRSRFLLDQDRATRSADLGGIYRSLGFEQLAIQQGTDSINRNPLNYSAHRLLADTYTTMPRSEFTRVNEFFMTQLLQPASLNPITPEQSEMTIGVFKGNNTSDLSLNEYSSLFEQNGEKMDLNFSLGGNNSSGHSVNISDLENNTNFSLSHYFYKSDGFRKNNQRSQEIYNQNIRSDISPNTSIMFEARSNKTKQGDIELRATEDINPDLYGTEDINTLRLGLKQNFGKRSVLLASIARQFGHIYELSSPEPFIFELDAEALMDIQDVRYIFVQDNYNLSVGGIRRNFHGINTVNFFLFPFLPPERFDTHYRNAYIYANLFIDKLSITLGGSYDTLDNDTISEDKKLYNSKLGFSWQPFSASAIRVAYFKTLQRPRFANYSIDPTLEPSQIAGFNQFLFSSLTTTNGMEAENRGIAFDHSFSTHTHVGIEAIKRDIKPPIGLVGAGKTVIPNWTENLERLYLYRIINSKTALTAEYILEKFDHGDDSSKLGVENFFNLKTQKLPITLNYFINKHANLDVKATHVDQNGDYFVIPDKVSVDDKFWIYDLILNYKLHQKVGVLQLSVMNIADKKFTYEDTNPTVSDIYPERLVTLKFKMTLQ